MALPPQRTQLAIELPTSGGRGSEGLPLDHGGERQVLQPLHHWVDPDCGVKVHSTNKHCVCVCVCVCQRMLLRRSVLDTVDGGHGCVWSLHCALASLTVQAL